ncbi:long-chain-fatty-acid--CoA ligase 5-like [Centruroides sculpturatus]|uniref:long-chain-fatty-acid--CoA ligase 5-like n=1 Tax=Centruroides sculpturatus TaxID=218467 RepID=UPI000C6E4737|nr:long-chain-fatty-acid--CoA ligase 5-like [Centruroides sculpturatus]
MDYLQYVGGIIGATAIASAAGAAALYYMNSPNPIVPPVDLNRQSIEQPDGARLSCLCKNGKLFEYLYDDVKTMYELMRRGARVSNNGPCLGWRPSKDSPYKWLSYNEVLTKAGNFGSGLVHIGVKPGQDTFIGIYSQNSVEWILTEHACYHISAIIVPLYDTLGTEACTFIVNETEIKTVVCDKEEKVKTILAEADKTPGLKQIITTVKISDETKATAERYKIQLYSFSEIEVNFLIKVQATVSGSFAKKFLLNFAMKRKQSELKRLVIRNNSAWDFVFKQVREGMGGRLRLLVCGSAPLASNVLTFIRCALGCVVVEGYGQTEGVAPCTLTVHGDYTAGHVGPPIPCCKIKLVDVPEMEYYASENKGEVRKNFCFKLYN